MALNAFNLLKDFTEDDALYLESKATAAEVKACAEAIAQQLKLTLPSEYAELLKHSNGLQMNNAYLWGTLDLLERNQELAMASKGWLILGDQGSLDLYAYSPQDHLYAVLDFTGDVVEEYVTLEKLIQAMMEAQELG